MLSVVRSTCPYSIGEIPLYGKTTCPVISGKYLCLFLLAIMFLIANTNAQVYTGDLTLTTQTDVDSFNYTSVTGNLSIQESFSGGITNLNGLSELITIGKNLVIYKNFSLTNIDGLSSLNSVADGLIIFDNQSLTGIDALSNLKSVNEILHIEKNDALTNVGGLSNLNSVGGIMFIYNNAALSNIDGFSNLSSVGGNLFFEYNNALTNLDGLSNLNSVGGNLTIQNNPNLTGFCGLYALFNNNGLTGTYNVSGNAVNPTQQQIINGGICLQNITLTTQAEVDAFNYTSVTGNLTIEESVAGNITNLDGLSELNSVGGFLSVRFNTGLLNVDGLSNLTSIGGTLSIRSNNTLTDIDGLSNLTSIGNHLFIVDHPELTNIDGLSNLTHIGNNLNIESNAALTGFCGLYALFNNNGLTGTYNVSGNAVNPTQQQIIDGGCPFTGYYGNLTLTSQAKVDAFNYTSVMGYLLIQETVSGNISNLDGLSELTTVGGFLQIDENVALTNIDGLSNLLSVGEYLQIYENDALTNIDGLSGLINVGEYLSILGCGALTNVDGLSGLISVGSNLNIIGCGSLTNVDGLSGLTSVASILNIEGNGALTNVDGLSGLTSVGNNLNIINNAALTKFCGLYTLLNNNGLTGTYNVSGNASNPAQQEIIDDGLCTSGIYADDLSLTTQTEVDAFSYTKIIGTLTINDAVDGNITNLDGLSELTSVKGLTIQMNSALTNADGLYNLTTVQGDLIINNNNLSNINGLSNLIFVGGSADISSNSSLNNIDGLSSLTNTGGGLIIYDDTSLINLNGLSSLNSVGGNLVIVNNKALNEFCGLHLLLSGNGLNGSFICSGNALNPDSELIRAGGPCEPLSVEYSEESGITLSAPEKYFLGQNYPNPFNPSTIINYQIPEEGFVLLRIYNTIGEEVKTLVNENKSPGNYNVYFNTEGLSSGIYIYQIKINNFISSRKMIVIK